MHGVIAPGWKSSQDFGGPKCKPVISFGVDQSLLEGINTSESGTITILNASLAAIRNVRMILVLLNSIGLSLLYSFLTVRAKFFLNDILLVFPVA